MPYTNRMKDRTSETIQILGKEYAILRLSDVEMGGDMGTSDQGRAVIRINKDKTQDQQEETLLREVIHMVSQELVLDISEETTARLAVGLYSAWYGHG